MLLALACGGTQDSRPLLQRALGMRMYQPERLSLRVIANLAAACAASTEPSMSNKGAGTKDSRRAGAPSGAEDGGRGSSSPSSGGSGGMAAAPVLASPGPLTALAHGVGTQGSLPGRSRPGVRDHPQEQQGARRVEGGSPHSASQSLTGERPLEPPGQATEPPPQPGGRTARTMAVTAAGEPPPCLQQVQTEWALPQEEPNGLPSKAGARAWQGARPQEQPNGRPDAAAARVEAGAGAGEAPGGGAAVATPSTSPCSWELHAGGQRPRRLSRRADRDLIR